MSTKKNEFLCGVCEGFYGRPWSTVQRKELFRRMKTMGLNTYMYAPKDDYKHRQFWKDLYSQQEQDELKQLIQAADAHGVTFVYALSPGLDMTYSSQTELSILKTKLDQIAGLGCTAFALLYDDIDVKLCEEDELVFDSFAEAHSHVTNAIYHHLKEPPVFLFCPTEYCTSRAEPTLSSSDYLRTVGEKLHKDIDVFWTGPKIVSRTITVESIQELISVIKRKPIIWDNLHANDYDQTRVFFGPYQGRSPELKSFLKGILTNPNCEFEANYVAMHTLGSWSKFAGEEAVPMEEEGSETEPNHNHYYKPKVMLKKALSDWLPYFYHEVSADLNEENKSSMLREKLSEPKDNQHENSTSAASGDNKENNTDRLTEDDLLLMADMFYLPYDNGSSAVNIIKEVHWLIENAESYCCKMSEDNSGAEDDGSSDSDSMTQTREYIHWCQRKQYFTELFKDVVNLVDKLVNIPNRSLLYDIYPYVVDMRSVLSLLNSYIRWISDPDNKKRVYRSGEQEAGMYRSGLYAELRRMVPFDGRNDTYPQSRVLSPVDVTFNIRPYFPQDKEDLYRFCLRTCDEGEDGADLYTDHPDVISDKLIGAFLELSPSTCYIVEDDAGICGYAVSTPDVKTFGQDMKTKWLPKMCSLYPKPYSDYSKLEQEIIQEFHECNWEIPEELYNEYNAYIHMMTSKNISDKSTTKRLLHCVQQVLKTQGVYGVMTSVQQHASRQYTFFTRLGFNVIKTKVPTSDSKVFLGLRISNKH